MKTRLICALPILSLLAACSAPQDSPVIEGPSVLSISPAPPYPPMARMAGISGEMNLRGTLDSQGTVQTCTIESGPALRDLRTHALTWVRMWQFQPALSSGNRSFLVKVRYQLIEEGDGVHHPQYPWCVIGICHPTDSISDAAGQVLRREPE